MTPESPSEEQRETNRKIAVGATRAFGAGFMVLSPIVAFDVAGAASAINLADGVTEKILGGVLFAVGIVDFYVMPILLGKMQK